MALALTKLRMAGPYGRTFATSVANRASINSVCVIGSGLMGSGIAQVIYLNFWAFL